MPKPLASPLQYVDLTPWHFALWWGVLLTVHLLAGGYNAAFAVFYYELEDTYLYRCLEYSGIGMPAEDHPIIAHVNALMAATHGGCALLMVGGSLWHRELVFSPMSPDSNQAFQNSYRSTKKLVEPTASDRLSSRLGLRLESMRSQTLQVYTKVWGRKGLMGVNGNNFHAILVVRELLETVLQTVQAYRMSWYLPRVLLNRFYLCLLVLNCWSSVLIYSYLFKRNEARKRFASLVSDCILDLVSYMGVPLIVVLSYVGDYDTKLKGFPLIYWYDDMWSARVLNEFQMVLVVSWSDLMSRTVFSFGLVATTTSLKELLRKIPARGNKRRISNGIRVPVKPKKLTSISPIVPGVPKPATVRGSSYNSSGLPTHRGQRLLHFFTPFSVHPWAMSDPACYLAILDCHRLGISGLKAEVEGKWSEFDRSTVVTLAIRHCTALEIPDSIGDFHLTTGIKVYNSTINDWGASAAVTNTNHTELIWLYFVRVHLPDGRLPEGIMSSDFPGNLYDLEFTYTNVREVPDDLDTKWLIGTTVYFEYSELTSVPPVILRLNPYSISFIGSPITELPPEVFEVPDMVYLYMGSIAIQELPYNVSTFSPGLAYIYLTDTNVSFFWPWIDPLVERTLDRSRPPLLMGGSKYCTELEEIKSGEAETFNVLPSDKYSLLMDASMANQDIVLHAVNCDLDEAEPVYPIAFEDTVSALI